MPSFASDVCVCVCVGEPELRVTRLQESMREGEAEMRRVPFGFCESSGRLGSIAASIAAGCDDAHAARDDLGIWVIIWFISHLPRRPPAHFLET